MTFAARQQEREYEQRLRKVMEGTLNGELEALRYALSHDVCAPLRHLDGFMTLLRARADATLDAESRHCLDKMAEASGRMRGLMDDVALYLGDAVVEMHVCEVALSPLVQGIIDELAPHIGERAIEWRVSALPLVQGDPALLRRAFYNLIDNALKFTRRRALSRITIGCKEEGENAVLCITDNGEGFDMSYAPKLFRVLQRLHAAHEFEGSGIGLASVARIVSRHGGRVWAEAVQGQGASFFVSIPRLA